MMDTKLPLNAYHGISIRDFSTDRDRLIRQLSSMTFKLIRNASYYLVELSLPRCRHIGLTLLDGSSFFRNQSHKSKNSSYSHLGHDFNTPRPFTMKSIILHALMIISVTAFTSIKPSFGRKSCLKLRMAESSKNGEFNPLPIFASVGVAETAYLSWLKISDSQPLCLAGSSCNDVLTGPYSTLPFVDIPLPFVGLLGYLIVLVVSTNTEKKPNQDITLFTTAAMATFSAYLMFIITFILHTTCPYCYLSAGLSTAMAVTAWNSRIVPNISRAFGIASTAATLTALSSIAIFFTTNILTFSNSAQASTAPLAQILEAESGKEGINKPPKLTKETSIEALEIANQLKAINAKMYGAYWCSHCYNQKQELGIKAYDEGYYQYIECDKEGFMSEFPLCRSKKIPGYPTWEINGKLYPGEKTLQELKEILSKS